VAKPAAVPVQDFARLVGMWVSRAKQARSAGCVTLLGCGMRDGAKKRDVIGRPHSATHLPDVPGNPPTSTKTKGWLVIKASAGLRYLVYEGCSVAFRSVSSHRLPQLVSTPSNVEGAEGAVIRGYLSVSH